ncbi:hypothetical protein BO86DRAFT_35763 [Aspergillus japonicus CBS 114.51]|uniref:Uncharacterized protein n=1 Tax=Aspergillus japonicus CBS 114.51 TaxID=1448312 RepID=A0A8T8X6R5_ASPJA|nr:hypothetical protein BO86DRAFT_35763 [Aspergillus japonicus CBS 114.51]RAH83857.1 hypothetical protein BO86DRAFT_35763 [Aspergillus japonicus CBS 114.51]
MVMSTLKDRKKSKPRRRSTAQRQREARRQASRWLWPTDKKSRKKGDGIIGVNQLSLFVSWFHGRIIQHRIWA